MAAAGAGLAIFGTFATFGTVTLLAGGATGFGVAGLAVFGVVAFDAALAFREGFDFALTRTLVGDFLVVSPCYTRDLYTVDSLI